MKGALDIGRYIPGTTQPENDRVDLRRELPLPALAFLLLRDCLAIGSSCTTRADPTLNYGVQSANKD